MRRLNPTQESISQNSSIGRVLAYVLLLLTTTAVHAQSTTTFAEQYKQIQAPNAVASIGSELFGDQINLYNGKLEFVQTDVSLKGNNALPVSVGRRFVAGTENLGGRQFFQWDLDVPHLHGIFSVKDKWRAINGATAGSRCSNFGAPPDVLGSFSRSSWTATEFWQGNFMYIPGLGDQQMLRYAGDSTVPGPLATYPVRTAKWWYFSCLPSMKNDASEGFVALSPDGTRYQFDWMVTFPVSQLTKDAGTLTRNEVWILPTRVTDRFGNYVDYTYDPIQPKNLTKIKSSDGREINLTYSGTDGLVRTVYDGTRTWNYSYSTKLDVVTLPDNSSWNFANAYGLIDVYPGPSSDDCDNPAALNGILKQGSMVHPSGATGTFVMTPMAHGRSDVPRQCVLDNGSTFWARIPRYFYSNSLTSKTISGPGLPSMTWAYNYGPLNASWAPCDASCTFNKTVSVTDPQGIVTSYKFGNRYNETEGRLESVDVGGQRTTTTRYRAFGAGPYPNYAGASGGNSVGDADMLTRLAPVDQRVITQDGVTFVWEAGASSFDVLARPTQITRSSSLGMTRTEVTQFEDNVSAWVIGQVKQVTETSSGKVMVLNSYNAATANLESTSKFGQVPQSMTYYGDGTLATRTDGKNQTTSFSNYKRGVPQNVVYADGTSESAVIDNIGNVTSLTNAVGFPTAFGYTAGRLSSISYPTDPTMNGTTLSFAPVAATEFDLPAGHWKQTVSTGNARTISYFDAFWRPAYSYTYDIGNEGGTGRLVKRQYDSNGRTTFESYPKRTYSANPDGMLTQYDVLGRVTATGADSELGFLWTTSSYASGFQKSVTDPKGHVTTSSYQVFDEPSESAVSTITAPLGVGVAIARDVFGKPLSITRSGGGLSATRSYVYDGQERLCKTIEPETGATVQDYDAANNVIWRASGNALPATTSCDTGSVAPARKVTFGYDTMNRLTSTSYADGSPAITRSYTNDGLPATVTSNGAVWTNSYNNRRQNWLESLSYGGATYNITRSYDANGSLASLTYPVDGLTVAYSPNALGQPTQVGSYAGGITYHPNGAIAGFTYGNGVTHTLTQNRRGLPGQSIDAGVLNDSYTYDADGNVAGIADLQMGTTNRTMDYDELERLTSVSAPNLWGNASYTYDALDNLRTSTITGGATARALTMNYPDPSTNRLMSTSGGPAGFNVGYSYDVQGNIIQRGAQSYVFDQGNRMTSAPGTTSYGYDGLGHRVSVIGTDGVNRVQVYSQGGQILYAGPTGSTGTNYVYMHNHMLAEVGPGGVQYDHTDGLGSPVARTNGYGALISRTRYEPYGYTAAGAVPSIGFTGHVNDADTALVYMQQRYYDPVAGRFLSIDPVTTDENTGDSFNRYTYANNSPNTYIDPDGRDSEIPIVVVTGKRPSPPPPPSPSARPQEPEAPRSGFPPHHINDPPIQAMHPECALPAMRFLCSGAEAAGGAAVAIKGVKGLRKKPGSLGQPKGTDALRRENEQARAVDRELGLPAGTTHKEISGQGFEGYTEILQYMKELGHGK